MEKELQLKALSVCNKKNIYIANNDEFDIDKFTFGDVVALVEYYNGKRNELHVEIDHNKVNVKKNSGDLVFSILVKDVEKKIKLTDHQIKDE